MQKHPRKSVYIFIHTVFTQMVPLGSRFPWSKWWLMKSIQHRPAAWDWFFETPKQEGLLVYWLWMNILLVASFSCTSTNLVKFSMNMFNQNWSRFLIFAFKPIPLNAHIYDMGWGFYYWGSRLITVRNPRFPVSFLLHHGQIIKCTLLTRE